MGSDFLNHEDDSGRCAIYWAFEYAKLDHVVSLLSHNAYLPPRYRAHSLLVKTAEVSEEVYDQLTRQLRKRNIRVGSEEEDMEEMTGEESDTHIRFNCNIAYTNPQVQVSLCLPLDTTIDVAKKKFLSKL